jgi:hypothetical protein
VAAGDGEAVGGHRAGLVGRARGQRRLEDRLHRADPRLVRRVEQQDPTAPQQGTAAVVFHAAANASNSDDSPLGDYIYTALVRSRP